MSLPPKKLFPWIALSERTFLCTFMMVISNVPPPKSKCSWFSGSSKSKLLMPKLSAAANGSSKSSSHESPAFLHAANVLSRYLQPKYAGTHTTHLMLALSYPVLLPRFCFLQFSAICFRISADTSSGLKSQIIGSILLDAPLVI